MSPRGKSIGVPGRKDVPVYKVRLTVVKAHSGCGAEHKVGDTWEISHDERRGQKGFICPSAFQSLYHVIFAMRYGAEFPWSEDGNSVIYCCPDLHTPVFFKIERSEY
jgi:uncharacterized repeat protein (TIGR04076 family)